MLNKFLLLTSLLIGTSAMAIDCSKNLQMHQETLNKLGLYSINATADGNIVKVFTFVKPPKITEVLELVYINKKHNEVVKSLKEFAKKMKSKLKNLGSCTNKGNVFSIYEIRTKAIQGKNNENK